MKLTEANLTAAVALVKAGMRTGHFTEETDLIHAMKVAIAVLELEEPEKQPNEN